MNDCYDIACDIVRYSVTAAGLAGGSIRFWYVVAGP